ncbi:MAG: hypothetical protein QW478_07815 [Candidatus Micrarchaeaceae archaeon]
MKDDYIIFFILSFIFIPIGAFAFFNKYYYSFIILTFASLGLLFKGLTKLEEYEKRGEIQ